MLYLAGMTVPIHTFNLMYQGVVHAAEWVMIWGRGQWDSEYCTVV